MSFSFEGTRERVLDAVRDLSAESGDATFGVAEVVARAHVSLKSFYRCFASKDELLLALLAEESRIGAAMAALNLDAMPPGERLAGYVRELFSMASTAPGYSGVLVRHHRRLSVEHPDALAAALAPLVDLLDAEIRTAVDLVGADGPLEPPIAARLVFTLVLEGLTAVIFTDRTPEDVIGPLWSFLTAGLHIDRKEVH